jgi:hypothetical protein
MPAPPWAASPALPVGAGMTGAAVGPAGPGVGQARGAAVAARAGGSAGAASLVHFLTTGQPAPQLG